MLNIGIDDVGDFVWLRRDASFQSSPLKKFLSQYPELGEGMNGLQSTARSCWTHFLALN